MSDAVLSTLITGAFALSGAVLVALIKKGHLTATSFVMGSLYALIFIFGIALGVNISWGDYGYALRFLLAITMFCLLIAVIKWSEKRRGTYAVAKRPSRVGAKKISK
jgi:hypothetical protein